MLLLMLEAQRERPLEIIVVDNNSSDGSGELARTEGVRVIVETRPGVAAAAAAGYDAARGEVIVRCDADTRPGPTWTQRISEHFSCGRRIDALTGIGRFYDLPGWFRGFAALYYFGMYYGGIGAALAKVPLWGSNMAFRRRVWEAHRLEVSRGNPSVHDDLELSCLLDPALRVRLDMRLKVGVAGRCFDNAAALRESINRARMTLALHGGTAKISSRYRSRIAAFAKSVRQSGQK